jgi:hypothetical protein
LSVSSAHELADDAEAAEIAGLNLDVTARADEPRDPDDGGAGAEVAPTASSLSSVDRGGG